MTRVAVVAPARTLPREAAIKLEAILADFSDLTVDIHPQCFFEDGHFAGSDEQRLAALLEVSNDPSVDAVWFARGGYGSCRLVDEFLSRVTQHAEQKRWLGYSDTGYLLSGLDRRGIGLSVHAPMPADGLRERGGEAIIRVLQYLSGDRSVIEPAAIIGGAVALNISILASLAATSHTPKLHGRILMIEEVDEHLYALDRALFTAFSSGAIDGATGLCLGRVSAVPENDVPFGEDAEAIVQRWCAMRGVPYLGRADIGHDAENKIVPYR